MNLDQAFAELRTRNRPVPRPGRLPTEHEVALAEAEVGEHIPEPIRRFLLVASDVVVGTMEPVTLDVPSAHTFLPKVVRDARATGVPPELFPFCEDNGDYYCLCKDGSVQYWDHNGSSDERWPSLAAWIEGVWLDAD